MNLQFNKKRANSTASTAIIPEDLVVYTREEVKDGKTYLRSVMDCPICGSQQTSQTMKQHLRVHRLPGPQIEEILGAMRIRKNREVVQHGGQIFKCPYCGKMVSLKHKFDLRQLNVTIII